MFSHRHVWFRLHRVSSTRAAATTVKGWVMFLFHKVSLTSTRVRPRVFLSSHLLHCLVSTDHRCVGPAGRRDHGARPEGRVQGRPHRQDPHPDQPWLWRTGGTQNESFSTNPPSREALLCATFLETLLDFGRCLRIRIKQKKKMFWLYFFFSFLPHDVCLRGNCPSCFCNHGNLSPPLWPRQLHYLRLPKDISEDHVILMDSTVSTGAAAMMAVRVLLVGGD